ncbi:hypothetical protein CAPTEDRAFT_127905 [Capitella teleta]|uniref:Citrate transporter-like domain-containing protein n=1 Tax=Capitella teleta TaxID=283909 RepID=R7UDV2_CAPTE|nr:hypothetical protein CAPTEDRAFT_127905 [Capitella teleta]|eukprot:ELU04585.1 hypothetical protein CAPTEDRAFT_127905 [Capitella teleta]
MTCCKLGTNPLWDIAVFWKTIIFILTPIACLPLVLVIDSPESRCAYGICVMAVYWVTEAIPLPVTALLPVVIFPMVGVLPAKTVATNFIKDTNLVFMGGLMVAVSIEHSDLHRRIALRVLLFMGSKPRWLLLGFMLPTWFLSMWISNTATAAMMVPVAEAVLQQLRQGILYPQSNNIPQRNDVELQSYRKVEPGVASKEFTPNNMESETTLALMESAMAELDCKMKNMAKMLCLAVAYSANIGGMATLTGTPPNLVLDNVAEDLYSSHNVENPISFASWLPFGFPSSVICLVLAWVWLQILFMGKAFIGLESADDKAAEEESQDGISTIVREEYESLGPIRFAEGLNMVVFAALVLLWFFRGPGFMDGYDSFFKKGYVSDSVPAIFIGVLLFALPSQRPKLFCMRARGEKAESSPGLVDWHTISTRLPWGPVFILGGGFAIAAASSESGLSEYLGEQLRVFKDFPVWGIVMLISALVAGLTEIASNTAIANITLPILAALAESIGTHPLTLMLPATLSASFAFMLPVATPPNAIVFSYGHLSVWDMIKAGFLMNVMCILVSTLATMTWATSFYNLDDLPWAFNSTASP